MKYDIEVRQIIPYAGEGYAKASLMLRIGPLMVRGAKIFEKENNRWLSMPSRRTKTGRWIEIVHFEDKQEKADIENAVLSQYDLFVNQHKDEIERLRTAG